MKPIVSVLLAILAVGQLSACTTLPESRTARVEGVELSYLRQGEGGPAIVLEAGLGDDMTSWRPVIDSLAERSTVFAYNRAGYPPSQRSAQARTPDRVVDELRQLLREAGVRPPYLLVGHSLGGRYSLNFVERYPREVAGVVLVDARPPLFAPECRRRQLGGCELPAALRLLMPQQVRDEYAASNDGRMLSTLGDMPLAVVSRTPGYGMESKAWLALWSEMQRGLSELSGNSKRFIAENSGHYVHQSEPALVLQAIEWTLRQSAGRRGDHLSGK